MAGNDGEVREGSQCDSVDRGISWLSKYYGCWVEEDEEDYDRWREQVKKTYWKWGEV